MPISASNMGKLVTMVRHAKEADIPPCIELFQLLLHCDEAQAQVVVETIRYASAGEFLTIMNAIWQAGAGRTTGDEKDNDFDA
jgi:hypothetical protein